MNEVEKHTLSVEDQKTKIRQRYKGIDTDLIDIIPCITQEDFYNDTNEKRVAVYARVSTDGINQTSSYVLLLMSGIFQCLLELFICNFASEQFLYFFFFYNFFHFPIPPMNQINS